MSNALMSNVLEIGIWDSCPVKLPLTLFNGVKLE